MAISGSMQEAGIGVSDWLLSFLQARDPDLYERVYEQLIALLQKPPLSSAVFQVLIDHQDEVFSILNDAKTNKFVPIKVPAQGGVQGQGGEPTGESIEKTKKQSEVFREAEEFFTVLLKMALYFDELEGEQTRLGDCIFKFTRKTDLPEFRLKLTMLAYNSLPAESSYRWATFRSILSYANQTNLFHLVVPYLDLVEDWHREWNLTQAQKRELFAMICTSLKPAEDSTPGQQAPALAQRSRDVAKNYGDFLRRYVNACDGEDDSVLGSEEAVKMTVQLLLTSLKECVVTKFQKLLACDAVNYLRKTSHAPLVELFDIFVEGGPQAVTEHKNKHPDLFVEGKGNVNFEECLAKSRLFALTALAAKCSVASTGRAGTLRIATLAEQLGMEEGETEKLLVQAVDQKLINAKIDQINGIVTVRSAALSHFGRREWELVLERLQMCNKNTRALLESLRVGEA